MENELTLGGLISDRRKSLRMSVEEVASQAEISDAYLRKIESNRIKSPSAQIIFRLARILQAELEEFARIFTKPEETLVEKEIEAIHQQFPELKLIEIADLPSLVAKKQYLGLLKTLSMYRGGKGGIGNDR